MGISIPEGVSPDLFSFLELSWAQGRGGDKIAKILRINRKKLMSVDIVFFDIIKKIEIRRAGAFVARMWLSKKENFRKRTCFCFAFLTANPGKP